ncbi:hypothetical protein Ahy_B02g058381 [Arachis hypogaea]|uniref:Ribonuclease H1 N-terminal domain-containing protein n=1 Tax=Arachis hypogaea TaxID=3818 RepID=A0A445AEJ5_ARAHY|nr:hypothetical protein Ahy_B02g058381 [Arachis hypogaea]
MNNGKYRLYAVRRGRIPRIYTSWEDYKEQVNGFKDAEFKGFCLLRDAQHWLGVVNPPLTLPPPPELDSGVHPLTGLFEQPFSLSKHFNSMHVGPTLGESSQKAFVPCSQIPQGTGASVDMEVYLIRVCCQVRLDYPVFNRREFFSDSDHKADASFKMLGKVLSLVGKEIQDYNYRIVAALRVRVEKLERQLPNPVHQRIRDLEQKNRKLRSDLQKYNDLFET